MRRTLLGCVLAGMTRTFNITWDGDDRHGVLATDSTTTTPTWYVRK